MKRIIFLALFLIIITSKLYGETIYCSYEVENKSEDFLLERSGDKFNWTTFEKNKFTLKILDEDDKNLIIGNVFRYDEVPRYLTIWIEKNTKKVRGQVIDKPSNVPTNTFTEGTCRFF